MIIDQPSQVFFPSGKYDQLEELGVKPVDYDEDLKNTRRIFETLNLAIGRTQGKLQIIVTEHASEETWEGLSTVRLVANWHSGEVDYLIPRDWMDRHAAQG